MKRFIRNVLIVFACTVLVLLSLIFYSFLRTRPLAPRQQLSGGAIQVKDGIVSAAILPFADRQVILVDCGNDAKAGALLAALGSMGLGTGSVKAIFLTHSHPDHIAGCKMFPDAQIYAMERERGLLEGTVASRSIVGRLMGKKNSGLHIAKYLQDGDSVQLGNVTVVCYLIPGHTEGSAAYLAAETLYLGDSADAKKDGTLLPAKRFASSDPQENRVSLARLAERLKPQASQIQFLEFAHSGPLTGLEPLLDFGKDNQPQSK
jgi:hydroxyacylglutathione hydrolase